MLKKKLILKDPLKFLGVDPNEEFPKCDIGAIVARAGVGKTAFLVQIAISALLKEKRVLHVSVQDLVDKVNLWYVEMFQNITKEFESEQTKMLWDELLTHRFIMTFEGENFKIDKLLKRITELKSQNIFSPALIILDGFSYDSSEHDKLKSFIEFVRSNSMNLWLCIRTNIAFESDPDELLTQIGFEFSDLLDVLVLMIPEKDRILVKQYIPPNQISNNRPTLFLDPSTMLIREDPCISIEE